MTNQDKIVVAKDGLATTNTKLVADIFKKEHRHVIRDINQLKCSPEFKKANFVEGFYISEQNKKLKCYDITRDGFAFLCMGFTGAKAAEWKEKYINAFNQMESALTNLSPMLETVNQIIKRAESDKQIASDCGKQLSNYRKVKKQNEEDLSSALNSVQLSLGFIK